MKKIIERFRFEGWKTILLPTLGIKLILDALFFWLLVTETEYIAGGRSEFLKYKQEYVNKFSWFMYLCFGIIILFDVIMLLRVIFSSQHKPKRLRLNTELNLFLKNSRTKTERFCLTTLIVLIVPFVLMTGYMYNVFDELLLLSVLFYAPIYFVITATLIKPLNNVSKQKKYSKDMLIYLKASSVDYSNFSGNLFNENAVVFKNLTDYMISSFSTGKFSPSGNLFYDLDNELIPWLGDIPQFKADVASRRNHIVVADCDKIEDINAFVHEIYGAFRRNSSKYACLTVGLVNARSDISEKNFDFGLSRDIKIVSFSSYKTLELMSLSAGRIPVLREIGTVEENLEAKRIAEELAGYFRDENKMKEKVSEYLRETDDISTERFYDVTEPDYSYVITSIVMDNISSQRMRNIILSRFCCYYLGNPEFRLCNELRGIGVNPEINPDNEYLYSILKNILFEPSEVKRIMGLFDYIDFMLRTVEIYSYIKQGGEEEAFEVETGFYNLAHRILEYTPESDTNVRKVVSIPWDALLNMIIGSVKQYFNLISATGNIDFCGLCHLIDIVRNKTRGHGSIKEENGSIIHSFLLIAIELLHDFLDIKSFSLVVENNRVFAGYGNERYDCSKIIYVKDGLPCIPIRMQGGCKEYINFFKGKYIVPDFVQNE